ncbi:hypothetical protein P3S67_001017 [Capsicum chacoense]
MLKVSSQVDRVNTNFLSNPLSLFVSDFGVVFSPFWSVFPDRLIRLHSYVTFSYFFSFFVGEKHAFALCRVFQKSGAGPKNGEQHGAAFMDKE